MRRSRFAASVWPFAVMAVTAVFSEVMAAAPEVRFPEPVFDFGQAVSGGAIEHVFEFTNTGSAKLTILGVYPTCHCTIPGDYTREVAPGQAGHITLLLDTSDLEGPVTKTTVVSTTDRAHFNLALSFRGTVWKAVEIAPRTLVLRPNAGRDGGDTNTVQIISHLSQPLTVGAPASDNPALKPRLTVIIPGKEFRLQVRAAASNASAMSQGIISLRTSAPQVPVLAIPVLVIPGSDRGGSGGSVSPPRQSSR